MESGGGASRQARKRVLSWCIAPTWLLRKRSSPPSVCYIWPFYQASQPGAKQEAEPEAATGDQPADGGAAKEAPKGDGAGAATSASSLFGAFGKRHYDGGFDEKMTRKEAALILGVRERAPAQRIKVSLHKSMRSCFRLPACPLPF